MFWKIITWGHCWKERYAEHKKHYFFTKHTHCQNCSIFQFSKILIWLLIMNNNKYELKPKSAEILNIILSIFMHWISCYVDNYSWKLIIGSNSKNNNAEAKELRLLGLINLNRMFDSKSQTWLFNHKKFEINLKHCIMHFVTV